MSENTILPTHIGFILDGNRRWARARGLPTFYGHKKGFDAAKKVVMYANKIGIKIVTMFCFSTENWNRSPKEVDYLMKLFEKLVDDYLMSFHKKGIKMRHLGSLKELPERLAKKIQKAVETTKNNTGLIFNIALNYGGRDEIKRTVQKIIKKGIEAKDVTQELINENLDTAGLPDPDMIVRTSGEERLSGFLTWQSAYSELYFIKKNWPDFDERELDKVIDEYNKRQRRFGA